MFFQKNESAGLEWERTPNCLDATDVTLAVAWIFDENALPNSRGHHHRGESLPGWFYPEIALAKHGTTTC